MLNKNKLHARLSSWSPKGRRVSGVAVLGRGGGVSGDPFGDIRGDTGRRCLTIVGAVMLRLMPLVVPSSSVLATLSLSLGMSSAYKVCDVNRRFAPGPDGVSYRT